MSPSPISPPKLRYGDQRKNVNLEKGTLRQLKLSRPANEHLLAHKRGTSQMLIFVFMKEIKELTAIIEREGDGYVALCPEFDVASQGDCIEEARANLIEALELFYETASQEEIDRRFHDEVLITRVQVSV